MTAPNSVNDCGTSPETSPPGTLAVPAHGNGLLRRGNPGNKGGGIPPSRLREALRLDFARRRKALRDIADNAEKDSDRLGAINLMARYGIGTETTMTVISPDVQGRLQQTLQLVMSRPEWKSAELMTALEAVWR